MVVSSINYLFLLCKLLQIPSKQAAQYLAYSKCAVGLVYELHDDLKLSIFQMNLIFPPKTCLCTYIPCLNEWCTPTQDSKLEYIFLRPPLYPMSSQTLH